MSYYMEQKKKRLTAQRKSVARKNKVRDALAVLLLFAVYVLIETIIAHTGGF